MPSVINSNIAIPQPKIMQNQLLLVILMLVLLSGCSSLISNTTGRIADNLAASILNSNDLKTVQAGAPAYLILLDGLLQDDQQNPSILLAASKLNSAYAGVFAEDEGQRKILSDKALNYALQALCISDGQTCQFRTKPFADFKSILADVSKDNIDALYAVGAAWTTWLEANAADFNAIAELSRVRSVMEQVVAIDESYDKGGAYLYLGGLYTLLPPALGGKPETGKDYFERALAISEGQNLMVKVVYAKQYARLVFDRELHDKLLQEVLKSDPTVRDLTLINTLAKQQAKSLLDEADDYF